MVWNIGDPGNQSRWSLESWVKGTVMLCLSLLQGLRLTFSFGEIGDHGEQFLIPKFWGLWGVLGVLFCFFREIEFRLR